MSWGELGRPAQMEKRMERSLIYNGTITAEQFLFYEIRIASKYYLDGTSVEDAIEEIKKNNLFQYPTERLVARMVRSCYKRLDALDDEQLRQELTTAASMAKTSRWRSWNASLISRARRTLSALPSRKSTGMSGSTPAIPLPSSRTM